LNLAGVGGHSPPDAIENSVRPGGREECDSVLRSIGQRPASATRTESADESSDYRELQLLRRVARQDRDAFKELYFIYHRRLLRFVLRMTSRQELAEEVLNDTMWIVWKKAAEFRAASQVSTWILGIAYRQTLSTSRRTQFNAASAEPEEYDAAVTEDAQLQAETRDWLDQGLAQLPLEQRMVLELTYFLGHSCEEIALIMDCPVNTVKTRMFHARRKLKLGLTRLADRPAE
jgi:RNA polymerase sigma-70 factor (ECF subfamily)